MKVLFLLSIIYAIGISTTLAEELSPIFGPFAGHSIIFDRCYEQTIVFRVCPRYQCTTINEQCEEYIVDMQTYLDITLNYKMEVQQRYCQDCTSYLGDDDAWEDEALINTAECIRECENIDNMEENGYLDAVEFVQCEELEVENSMFENSPQAYYSGAVCTDGGKRIKIGVFTDDQCTNYDETKDVEDYLVNEEGYYMKLSYHMLLQTWAEGGCVTTCLRDDGMGRKLDEDEYPYEVNRDICNNLYEESIILKCSELPDLPDFIKPPGSDNVSITSRNSDIAHMSNICGKWFMEDSAIEVMDGTPNLDDGQITTTQSNEYDCEYEKEYGDCVCDGENQGDDFDEEICEYDCYMAKGMEYCIDHSPYNYDEQYTPLSHDLYKSSIKFDRCYLDDYGTSFVVFRVYNQTTSHCQGNTFDEYMIDMDTYIGITVRYKKKVQREYCLTCMNEDCKTECNNIDNMASFGYGYIDNMESFGYADASDFARCTELERNIWTKDTLYVGPVCASNGTQINIGVFTDYACMNHDETKIVEDYLKRKEGYSTWFQTTDSMKLSYHLLKQIFAEDECTLPCSEGEDDEDGIVLNEACEKLYIAARKCREPPEETYGHLSATNTDGASINAEQAMHRYSFCGKFWTDARDNCQIKQHCEDDRDCPEAEFCWTQTPCDYYATLPPTTAPPSESQTNKPTTPLPTKKPTNSPIGTTPGFIQPPGPDTAIARSSNNNMICGGKVEELAPLSSLDTSSAEVDGTSYEDEPGGEDDGFDEDGSDEDVPGGEDDEFDEETKVGTYEDESSSSTHVHDRVTLLIVLVVSSYLLIVVV